MFEKKGNENLLWMDIFKKGVVKEVEIEIRGGKVIISLTCK